LCVIHILTFLIAEPGHQQSGNKEGDEVVVVSHNDIYARAI